MMTKYFKRSLYCCTTETLLNIICRFYRITMMTVVIVLYTRLLFFLPAVSAAQCRTGSASSRRPLSNVKCFNRADCVVIRCLLPFAFSLFPAAACGQAAISLPLTSNSRRSTSWTPPARSRSTLLPDRKWQPVVSTDNLIRKRTNQLAIFSSFSPQARGRVRAERAGSTIQRHTPYSQPSQTKEVIWGPCGLQTQSDPMSVDRLTVHKAAGSAEWNNGLADSLERRQC